MKKFLRSIIPVVLTILTFFALSFLLYAFIHILNLFPISDKIVPQLRIADILVGLTIYLKTSVDFALFIGNLMGKYTGVKNRIAIEIGTALGNAGGTCAVLFVWTFFKEVPLLMIAMIITASLVLFSLAQESLEELQTKNIFVGYLKGALDKVNGLFRPILKHILPHASAGSSIKKTFLALLLLALTIPLLLGLDDFAGYIPLFNIVNVFGFAIGVFFGHMTLNVALFASPKTTIVVVKKPIVAFLGSLAFIGIGLWGFVETYQIIAHLLR